MDKNTPSREVDAALLVLIVLQVVMLGALFTKTPPHPPLAVAPFAIAPFLGASIAVAAAALQIGSTASWRGVTLSICAAILGLVSFGPQKWFDPAIGEIWPAVVLGELAAIAVAWSCLRRCIKEPQH